MTSQSREELLNQLPSSLYRVFTEGSCREIDEALKNLTKEELERVRQILRDLAALDSMVSYEGTALLATEQPSNDDFFLQELEEFVPANELPSTFFQAENKRIVPPRTVTDAAKRGAMGKLYPVWFGTTRKPKNKDDLSLGFTGERVDNSEVYYGIAQVSIPKSHQFATTGSSWFRRIWTWNDDRLKLCKINPRNQASFWEELKSELVAFNNREEAQILLYVHGYKTSFPQAMVIAAQLGCDLGFPGLTACFSWASQSKFLGYGADVEAVRSSITTLAHFIEQLSDIAGEGRVHLIAHSLGNRATLEAVNRLVNTNRSRQIKLGQIILAAPDVDTIIFRGGANVYPGSVSLF